MLPPLEGRPIRVVVRASLGPHLAATDIPKRVIYLDRIVLEQLGDFERILVHELFHFAWVRAGNPRRRTWEQLLASEWRRGIKGELGWSAEWRKEKLTLRDLRERTGAWRRYICESFCDSAAWRYSGVRTHEEYTLPPSARTRRATWLKQNVGTKSLPV